MRDDRGGERERKKKHHWRQIEERCYMHHKKREGLLR